MAKPLSPAAQAIYEAAIEQSEYPNDAEWVVINALRAAADHVVPERLESYGIRYELLRIANELEASNA